MSLLERSDSGDGVEACEPAAVIRARVQASSPTGRPTAAFSFTGTPRSTGTSIGVLRPRGGPMTDRPTDQLRHEHELVLMVVEAMEREVADSGKSTVFSLLMCSRSRWAYNAR